MKDIDIYKKYKDNPKLYAELIEEAKRKQQYMKDDSIPPVNKKYGKSRLDIVDEHSRELLQRCDEHDFILACMIGDLDKVKQLVKHKKNKTMEDGINPRDELLNCTDERGWSGLDHAYFCIWEELVKYLSKNGTRDTENTPILREKYNQSIKNLQERGPSLLDQSNLEQ